MPTILQAAAVDKQCGQAGALQPLTCQGLVAPQGSSQVSSSHRTTLRGACRHVDGSPAG